jgi:hypothetical protein
MGIMVENDEKGSKNKERGQKQMNYKKKHLLDFLKKKHAKKSQSWEIIEKSEIMKLKGEIEKLYSFWIFCP